MAAKAPAAPAEMRMEERFATVHLSKHALAVAAELLLALSRPSDKIIMKRTALAPAHTASLQVIAFRFMERLSLRETQVSVTSLSPSMLWTDDYVRPIPCAFSSSVSTAAIAASYRAV